MDISIIERQAIALGQDRYEYARIDQDGRILPDIRRWPNLIKNFSRYAEANGQKENLYIRAIPDAVHPVIFLDDVAPPGLAFLRDDQGLAPACVVETSREEDGTPRLHLWFRLSRPVSRETRKGIERHLIATMKAAGHYADKGSACGGHYGRWAGAINYGFPHKPRLAEVVLVESTGIVLDDATTERLIEASGVTLAQEAEQAAAPLEELRNRSYDNPDIVNYFKGLLKKVKPDANPSDVDFFLAVRCAKRGYGDLDIRTVLLREGPNDVNRKRNAQAEYLARTVAAALKHAPSPSIMGVCGSGQGPAVPEARGVRPEARAEAKPGPSKGWNGRPRFGVKPRYAIG